MKHLISEISLPQKKYINVYACIKFNVRVHFSFYGCGLWQPGGGRAIWPNDDKVNVLTFVVHSTKFIDKNYSIKWNIYMKPAATFFFVQMNDIKKHRSGEHKLEMQKTIRHLKVSLHFVVHYTKIRWIQLYALTRVVRKCDGRTFAAHNWQRILNWKYIFIIHKDVTH